MLGVNTISVLGVETQDYLELATDHQNNSNRSFIYQNNFLIGIYYCDYVDFKILILTDIGNSIGLIFKKLTNQIKYQGLK